MKRRVIALLMIVAMAVGLLTGCSGTADTGGQSQPTKPAEPTKASAPTETPKPTAVPDSQTGSTAKFTEAPALQ